ncbi:MAG: NUDIX domain-containing protein [Syntrophales bacterium]|jgi:ADP-ribose pyrophosphatase YjhB (NUDIX family)|nr:NUDIX domain-containing protein [Syntrophales bacterium]MDY0045240.1 NUDIX hydrolase [Syntrophales bacterium]
MHRNDTYRHCPLCGQELVKKQIKKGERKRLVCSCCQYVFYIDPKIAACAIIEIKGGIVLLKRGIPPALGSWVIPGGFVDAGETVPGAAIRETKEEVCLTIDIGPLVGVYSYPGSSVIIIVYEAAVTGGSPKAADETLDVRIYRPSEIPWNEIGFTSTKDALSDYLRRHYPGTVPAKFPDHSA